MPTKKRRRKSPVNNYTKKSIPKALREQVWLHYFGKKYEYSCYIPWCKNNINVFDFHVGHNIPESKGGTLSLDNLRPICSRCNHSMGSQYTITEWMELHHNKQQQQPCCCFF